MPWVKNLVAAAPVVEARVQSLAWCSELKDLTNAAATSVTAVTQIQSLAQELNIPWVQPLKKKKEKGRVYTRISSFQGALYAKFRFPQSSLFSFSPRAESNVPSPFFCFLIYTSYQRIYSTAQSQSWINERKI